jgi:hypothetical protein
MTEFELLVSAALEARAATVTIEDLRPAAPTGPRPRRALTWRRVALGSIAAAAAAAACWLALSILQQSPAPLPPANQPGSSAPPAPGPVNSPTPPPDPAASTGP